MNAEIQSEDLPFHHYSFKHQVVAWVSVNLFDKVTYTVGRGLLKGLKRRGGLGWVPVEETETPETRFWKNCNLKDRTVYDVGSFHGLLAMFFATQAKTVVCFEPNTRNHGRLLENLNLNGFRNVIVRKVGAGSSRATLTMTGDPLMPGGSTLDSQAARSIRREGSVVETIEVVTLDEEIQEHALPAPDFIKIDIEGWELEALKGARRTLHAHKPELFLEMHGETLREKKRKVQEIVDFLWDAGYRHIQHIETGMAITPENAVAANQGHLFCRTARS